MTRGRGERASRTCVEHVESIELRHHQIEHQHVRRVCAHGGQGLLAVERDDRVVAGCAHLRIDDARDVGIVFGDDHGAGRGQPRRQTVRAARSRRRSCCPGTGPRRAPRRPLRSGPLRSWSRRPGRPSPPAQIPPRPSRDEPIDHALEPIAGGGGRHLRHQDQQTRRSVGADGVAAADLLGQQARALVMALGRQTDDGEGRRRPPDLFARDGEERVVGQLPRADGSPASRAGAAGCA